MLSPESDYRFFDAKCFAQRSRTIVSLNFIECELAHIPLVKIAEGWRWETFFVNFAKKGKSLGPYKK